MGINRRTFLKLSGLVAAGSLVGGISPGAAAQNAPAGIPALGAKAMLNDSSKCIGCLSCAIACKKANGLPDTYQYSPVTNGSTWTTVKFGQPTDKSLKNNTKIQCMHCNQASCVAVCPTGAARKRDDGIVLIDQETCIGCGYCVLACPFKVPGKSEETGTARKCTFCEKRLGEGKITACAEACPAGAIEFGNYDDLMAKAQKRVELLKTNGAPNAVVYGQKELGGLKVIYVMPEEPGANGIPGKPKPATGDSLLKWFSGLAMAGFLVSSPLRNIFKADEEAVAGSKGVNKDD